MMLRSPLLQALVEKHGVTLLTPENYPDFITSHRDTVLLFTENPSQFPESNDVAVILPQLIQHFSPRLKPALVDASLEKTLQTNFSFYKWPALVFLRQGELLGTIIGMQNWSDYIEQVEALLASPEAKELAVRFIPVASH